MQKLFLITLGTVLPLVADGTSLLQVIAWVAQIFTGLLTVLILYLSLRTARKLKKADVIIEDHRRFDQLLALKHELATKSTDDDVCTYFNRFWNLQSDEYDNWRAGLIGNKKYEEWLGARIAEHKSKETVGSAKTWTNKRGWEAVKDNYCYDKFNNFMDVVFDLGAKEAMKIFQPSWRVRLSRRLFS